MLVLKLSPGEEAVVVLPDGRRMTVTNCGNRRTGFDAPKDVRIYRRDVFADIQRNGLNAQPAPPAGETT